MSARCEEGLHLAVNQRFTKLSCSSASTKAGFLLGNQLKKLKVMLKSVSKNPYGVLAFGFGFRVTTRM